MKKFSLCILLIGFAGSLYSQNYKGTITVAKEDGLHKVLLTPEIRSASKENLNTIRIKQDNLETAYVLMKGSNKTFSIFKETEIVTKKAFKDSITSITIENRNRKKQESITLQIANTKITKNYAVFGSDDGQNWFGLIANQQLYYKNTANNTTSFEKTISFPLNTYKFIRIDFNDKHSLPINILKAGFYESKYFKQDPIAIKNFAYDTQTIQERKVTQLKFTTHKAYHIDVISFKISSPFFLRNAKVTANRTRKIKKRIETYTTTLANFQLNSKNNNTFTFNNLNEKEFIIEIENHDNLPLAIENVTLFQKPIYLISNLQKDKKYEIIIDSTLTKPSYDLGNFISNTTENITDASISNFNPLQKKKVAQKEKSFWQTNTFMWLCIILGGILVVYFSLGLLKDISKNENNT